MMNKKTLLAIAIVCLGYVFPMQAQKIENFTLQGSKGKLAATLQAPKLKSGEKVRLVVICHGFGSNKERPLLKAIADSLQSKGIASIRFDFNGCGKSEGKFQDMTVLNEIEDAKDVVAYALTLPWVSDISMVGHSQGGVVTSMVAGQLKGSIRSIALCAPAAVLRDDALRGSTQGSIYDPHHIPEYVDSPRGLRIGRDYFMTAQTLPIYETARQYTGPVLLVHGTWDVIVPYTYSEHYHEVYQNSELRLLAGVDHSFTGESACRKAAGMVAKFIQEH
ncbi:alpha/beta hydrolase family protein [Segatella baroniae]|uniref:alpha/beta hydrolase family protein n=1 Tax=Segatella baroniae TaxID=305719 RepID=UPI001E44CD60|nr:alpha/beta fold hydrolase [Segatella baroniae]